MTIDEAIEHAEERACGNDQCAKDHAQLADWLRELRRARMEIDLLKTLRDGFRADAQKYKAENARLREQWARLFDKTLELVTENAKLRELVRNMHSELVSCEDNGYVCGGHKFDYCVSELGIEVD